MKRVIEEKCKKTVKKKEFKNISTKFVKMAENETLQNSQNHTDSQKNTKNKYKTLQVIEIINRAKKLERTIRQFYIQTTVDIWEGIANVINLPSQIKSLFKYVHTSFRQVKSDPTVDAVIPFTIDHRAMTPCREASNYWSNPTWCFLSYPTRPVNIDIWDIKPQVVK